MYPYQRTPMALSLFGKHQLNTMGTLLGVHPTSTPFLSVEFGGAPNRSPRSKAMHLSPSAIDSRVCISRWVQPPQKSKNLKIHRPPPLKKGKRFNTKFFKHQNPPVTNPSEKEKDLNKNNGVSKKSIIWLVVSTQLKYMSQIGNLPQIGVKIKNIWNHHLDIYIYI